MVDVTLTETRLIAMQSDARFNSLGCLGSLPKTKGCGCKNKAEASREAKVNAVKQCIVGLDASQKKSLKEKLNARMVTVVYRTSSNKTVKYHF